MLDGKISTKLIKIDDALKLIENRSTIVTSMASSEPRLFFEHLASVAQRVHGVRVFCANPNKHYDCFDPKISAKHFEFLMMFLTRHVNHETSGEIIHYIPQHLSRWTKTVLNPESIDVFWGTCAERVDNGMLSLGLSTCYEAEVIKKAKRVILEVNPNIPWTYGSTQVPIELVDHFIEANYLPPTVSVPQPNDIDRIIGGNVAELIENGSTIQLGIGQIPQAIGDALASKKDLGVHSELINDAIMNLFKLGVINGSKKSLWPGKMVGAFAYGSDELYRFLNDNSCVEFQHASIVNDPYIIGKNTKMTSINTAVEIDLTGQCCSESVGHRELSGVGGASDTHTGAQRSEGGRGIIALHSTTRQGQDSKIVFELKPGAKVSISRNDIDTVVTEYGVAKLAGRSVSERAKAMIAIAHPKFREQLLLDAKRVCYI